MNDTLYIRELINRLARLDAAAAWHGDLNPTQAAVLAYLGRANRFSKSPSHVAEYLGCTRGTISQSFKSLLNKGYVTEHRTQQDKRTIRFELTAKGEDVAQQSGAVEQGVAALDAPQKDALREALLTVLNQVLLQNDGSAFGICKTCAHFEATETGGLCRLLSETLAVHETELICHEHRSLPLDASAG